MLTTSGKVDPSDIEPLCEAGFALHWLHPRSKRPVGEDWSTKPVATFEQLKYRHVIGYNVGVRTGLQLPDGSFFKLIDLDVRDPAYEAEARAKLEKIFPGAVGTLPSVISGSGGPSRHYWFVTDKQFPSKRLARSDGFDMVYDEQLGREVKKRHWEIDLFGPGKQAVIPPSIHPETGLPYRWEKEPDFTLLALGLETLPNIPSALIERLGLTDQASAGESLDLKPPLGLTEGDAQDILDGLLKHASDEYCEDHDGWINVGMALHHEFGGGAVGFGLWKQFSQHSAKFDERDLRIRWNSFRDKPNAFRMASLKMTADQFRALEMLTDDDDGVDDFADIIGTPCSSSAGDSGDDMESLADGAEADLGWISCLKLNDKATAYLSNLHNVKLIIANDPRFVGLAQRNLFTGEIHQRRAPGRKQPRRKNQPKPVVQLEGRIWRVTDPVNGHEWSDQRDYAVRAVIEAPGTQGGYGLKVSDRDLKAAIEIAADNNEFHPVREYFESINWDGNPRLDRMFVDYLGAEENPYTLSVARLMMVAAVTRIYEPGHKFDFAVILEGLQGRRKSTFIRVLGRSWSSELDGDFHDPKGMVEIMQSKMILELPELSGFARADVRAIKAFISRPTDRVRLAYARRAVDFPRQCIFVGTTNDREYLKDDTGGRRFWPIECHVESINTDRLEREVDQLWAEAVITYRRMRTARPKGDLPLYLQDEDAQRIAASLQESRRVESVADTWAVKFNGWLDEPIEDGGFESPDEENKLRYRTIVTVNDLWEGCLGGKINLLKPADRMQIGKAMTNLSHKWEKRQIRQGGARSWVWARIGAPPKRDEIEEIIG